MKKFAIGCGLVLLFACIAGGAVAYLAYSKTRSHFASFQENVRSYAAAFEEMKYSGTLKSDVTNRGTFIPPADGELSAAQVDRFLRVQDGVRTRLGTRFEELRTKYDRLKDRPEGEQPSIAEGLGALRDLAGLVTGVRQAHVDALNDQQMSVAEYHWLRDEIYVAADVPFTAFDVDAISRAAQSGDPDRIMDALQGRRASSTQSAVPAANVRLVQPHREKLREWVVLAWVGL